MADTSLAPLKIKEKLLNLWAILFYLNLGVRFNGRTGISAWKDPEQWQCWDR